ncbi:MAG TPA: sulfurtransferase-like selenium metabolism protein YedF [Syntrophorhabdaceae bacterium]|nr:sulfurtransferase-like selenium metabolism protein YedF [Syntrophorhabdaceae bacterium]HPU30525.1 sulfurtransferase-like selenium metabolism protein YedF [Syntrophorhabdaceae bacterium]
MKETVDARGLACPQPVLLTKKALETEKDITVIVDNTVALENVKRFAINAGCLVDVKEQPNNVFFIHILKTENTNIKEEHSEEISCEIEKKDPSKGPVIVVVSSNKMGLDDDELGIVLMRSFLHTLTEIDTRPDVLILYNGGVKLAIEGSDVLHDLNALENQGVKVLVCGTCLNFFNLKEKLKVGSISNMYDITETLFKAKKIIRP